jgi:hypothetical protein
MQKTGDLGQVFEDDETTAEKMASDMPLLAIRAILGKYENENKRLSKADKDALYPHFAAMYPRNVDPNYEKYVRCVFRMTCTTVGKDRNLAEDIAKTKSDGRWDPSHPAFDIDQVPYLAKYLQLEAKGRAKYMRRLRNVGPTARGKYKPNEFTSFRLEDLDGSDFAVTPKAEEINEEWGSVA